MKTFLIEAGIMLLDIAQSSLPDEIRTAHLWQEITNPEHVSRIALKDNIYGFKKKPPTKREPITKSVTVTYFRVKVTRARYLQNHTLGTSILLRVDDSRVHFEEILLDGFHVNWFALLCFERAGGKRTDFGYNFLHIKHTPSGTQWNQQGLYVPSVS